MGLNEIHDPANGAADNESDYPRWHIPTSSPVIDVMGKNILDQVHCSN
jgi:hypothetical protein